MGWWSAQDYVPVGERRARAFLEAQKMAKSGRKVTPVTTDGRIIASTFWGKAWCDNLESYSDFENRVPRGRSYVRNGSVVDLQIEPGKIVALVCGSRLYRIQIEIHPLPAAKWKAVQSKCRGQIGSLIELLQGRLSHKVMEIVTHHGGGLFPSPKEIRMLCSCPDWADMCKHVAAVLYGVGNRLDHEPELLFKLRQVDHLELIAGIADSAAVVKRPAGKKKKIAKGDLAQVFGIELDAAAAVAKPARKRAPVKSATPLARKTTAKKRGKRAGKR